MGSPRYNFRSKSNFSCVSCVGYQKSQIQFTQPSSPAVFQNRTKKNKSIAHALISSQSNKIFENNSTNQKKYVNFSRSRKLKSQQKLVRELFCSYAFCKHFQILVYPFEKFSLKVSSIKFFFVVHSFGLFEVRQVNTLDPSFLNPKLQLLPQLQEEVHWLWTQRLPRKFCFPLTPQCENKQYEVKVIISTRFVCKQCLTILESSFLQKKIPKQSKSRSKFP